MIDESPLRIRFEALRASLDERGRRLSAAAEAKAAGYGGDRGRRACDEGRPKHDWTRSEGPAGPRLSDREGASQGRGEPSVDDAGPDASGGLATIARARDDGRSDAAVAMGLQEPRQAGEGASGDGSQGELLDHSQTVGGT